MPELQVSVTLPYDLRLHEGDYPTAPAGEILQIRRSSGEQGPARRTVVRTNFTHPETTDQEEIFRLQTRDADQLLRRINRLLRWYRAVSHKTKILELTRAQASPFQFQLVGAGAEPAWGEPLKYKAPIPRALRLDVATLTGRVRASLASGNEPEAADLFLIDAERALYEGRFREVVLFCWSTIDAVFNRKYDALVNAALAEEWADARAFFTGVDFGLRNKMSAVMHLIANRSLFREPGGLWKELSESYQKRNAIIHRGVNATEDEARLALRVARRVTEVMNSL